MALLFLFLMAVSVKLFWNCETGKPLCNSVGFNKKYAFGKKEDKD